jgi:hypothetical protein
MIESHVVEAIRMLTFDGARLPYPQCDILLNAAEYLAVGQTQYKIARIITPIYRPEYDSERD